MPPTDEQLRADYIVSVIKDALEGLDECEYGVGLEFFERASDWKALVDMIERLRATD